MKEEIGNIIVNWANILYTRLQNACVRQFNMGITEHVATLYYNSADAQRTFSFDVREASGPDMLTGKYTNRICIEVPSDIMKEGGLQVMWRHADSRTEAIDMRKKACYRLAKEFVYKVLPKIDFWIRKEVNNKEIEDILEVLD